MRAGVVRAVEDYGGGPLLDVKLEDGRDVLVPFTLTICKEIDVAAKTIRAELPEGLLEPVIFHVLTIFPDFFRAAFEQGVVGKARAAGLIEIRVHDLRDWTRDRHRTVDDRPFGGGEGMLMKAGPIFEAVESIWPERCSAKKVDSALGARCEVRSGAGERVQQA